MPEKAPRTRPDGEPPPGRDFSLLDSVGAWLVVLDADGVVLHANRHCEERSSGRFHQEIGRHFRDIWSDAEEKCSAGRALEEIRSGQAATGVRTRYPGPEGRPRELSWSLRSFSGCGEELTLATGVETEAPGEEIVRSCRLYEQILNSLSDGILVSDPQGQFLFYNAAAEKLAGVRPVTTTPNEWPKVFGIFRADRVTPFSGEELPLVQATRGNFVVDQELFIRNPSVSEGTVLSVNAAPLRDADGQLAGGAVVFRDVSERKREQEALRRSEARARALLDVIPDVMFRIRLDGTFLDFRADDDEPLLIPRESIIGNTIWALPFPPDVLENIRMRMVRAAETGTLQANDYEVEVDGRRLNFEARIVHSGSDEVVCIIRNISDRKQAEERARQLQLELIHVARLSTMGEMASGIAHELNQPLTAIRNYAAACEESLRGLPAGVRDPVLEWVREIGDQANRAGEIIRRMRNLVSKRRPQRTRADVPEIIREVVGLFQSELRKRDIQIRLRLDEKLPPVEADPIQLQQVLLNLLRNAAEAFRPTPPTDFRITVRTRRRDGDQVEVSVADTGAGLSDEASEQAFEPFFTTKPDGMGIGLSISRSIIEAHGGRLWAESNPRGGSIFRFALPMAPPHVLGDDSPSP